MCEYRYRPSLPSCSAAGKDQLCRGRGWTGWTRYQTGTGVQQVYICIIVYVCVALGEESVVAKYTKIVSDT